MVKAERDLASAIRLLDGEPPFLGLDHRCGRRPGDALAARRLP